MTEDNEKRHYKRLDIDVTIGLKKLAGAGNGVGETEKIEVETVNTSKGGMAFITNRELTLDTFYDTKVVLWNKESVDCIINIVRKTVQEDGRFMYGCTFVGMNQSDQFKIDVYDIVKNKE